jgi:ubiquinone/menaquinone biosynthesis C-methylase UbiE
MGANKAASEKITTAHIPRPNESVDYIFLIFSAHEIRNTKERNAFFQELKRVLKKDGKIIMTEHLCDMANFLAYGPGVFHFWTEKTWLKCLEQTGMSVKKKLKITPWISSFLIGKS